MTVKDTDAAIKEAVLQFTLNRMLTYYKRVIRRTIRFMVLRGSYFTFLAMEANQRKSVLC